jgi:hypothetical protein
VDPANDTRPQITTIPIAPVDAPVQLIRGDNSGSAPVLRNQRPSLMIDLRIALFHCQCPGLDRPSAMIVSVQTAVSRYPAALPGTRPPIAVATRCPRNCQMARSLYAENCTVGLVSTEHTMAAGHDRRAGPPDRRTGRDRRTGPADRRQPREELSYPNLGQRQAAMPIRRAAVPDRRVAPRDRRSALVDRRQAG